MAEYVMDRMPKIPVVLIAYKQEEEEASVFEGYEYTRTVNWVVNNVYGPYDWDSNESVTRMHDHARALRDKGYRVECGWDLLPPCELDVEVTSNTRGVA